jgi:hypothetical protein
MEPVMQREPHGVSGDAQHRFDEMNEAKARWREHPAPAVDQEHERMPEPRDAGRPQRAPRGKRARRLDPDER